MDIKYKLLYIDDEKVFLELFGEALSDDFEVTILNNPFNIPFILDKENFDGILCDLHMPLIDGFTVIKDIKKHSKGAQLPLFLFSSDNTQTSRIHGLKNGSTDYIYKLMHIDEIILRIKKGIESNKAIIAVMTIGNLILDQNSFTVTINDNEAELTFTEYKLLLFLLKNDLENLNKEEMQNYVYGQRQVSSGAMRVHLTNLKKKLIDWDHEISNNNGSYLIQKKTNY